MVHILEIVSLISSTSSSAVLASSCSSTEAQAFVLVPFLRRSSDGRPDLPEDVVVEVVVVDEGLAVLLELEEVDVEEVLLLELENATLLPEEVLALVPLLEEGKIFFFFAQR